MPPRNVNLTDALDTLVTPSVKRGRYENASEVVSAGLPILEHDERENETKLMALRRAIDEGLLSGVAEATRSQSS